MKCLTINILVYISSESTNLALNYKRVGQSSYQPGVNHALKAIDGCKSSTFGPGGCCSHTQKNLNAWWQIDLGDIHAIFRIVVTLRGECK